MSWKNDCKKYGVELDQRWEKGVDHHPEAEKLIRNFASLDFTEFNDHFRIDMGGDGDNGEIMAMEFSIIHELRDAELKEKYSDTFLECQKDAEQNNISLLEAALKKLSQKD